MYRHILLIILAALMLVPAATRAQTPEPVGTVSASDTQVTRAYDNPNVFFDDIAGIMVLGSIERTEEDASRSAGSFATRFADAITSELAGTDTLPGDVVFDDMIEVPVTPIGDETIANVVTFSMSGTINGEYGFLTVRKGTWVQVLVGFGLGDIDVVATLVDLGTALAPRWPADTPIAVRDDGIRTGGIWTMMPLPEDVPEGFELDPDFEDGPGPTTATGMPASQTPAAATPVTGPVSPPVEPTRELPLIPTVTPTSEAPTLPTPTTAAITTPPVLNPRLALPFDVTVEIFLPLDKATIAEDGSCGGSSLLDGLSGDGTLTLREATTGEPAVTTRMSAPGLVAYDTEGQQDVCYLTATFTGVPARAEYTLLAGESVLGRFTYEDLTTGEPVLIDLSEG